jgi:hypothetical protein
MGRPLNKKFFGNRNIGSTSTTADDGIGGQGVASVTISGVWADFTQATSTVTFSAPQLPGGVTATGTVTITAGAPVSVTITEKGSGYTSAPTVTIADSDAGAETIGTATAVLTVDTGAPGSATNQENAISVSAFVTGGSSAVAGDIIKQTGGRSYQVKTAQGTSRCELVAAAPTAGQLTMTAVDSAGGTYYVTKITARRALIVKGDRTGTQFTTGTSGISVPWSFDPAVLNQTVRILNA